MRKNICEGLVLALALIFVASSVYAVDEFLSGEPAGTQNISLIDDLVEDNNIALERGLADLRTGAEIIYASASTLTISAGNAICANSDKSVLRMRINTSSLTLTWSDIDTGAEANSQKYYIFAAGDADTATFLCYITESSTAPSGITYYKRLGSFFNNSSGNIERIDNEDLGMWEQDSDEVQLKQADALDMQSKKIISLDTPTADGDAATKAYVDGVVAGTGLWEIDGTETQLVTADEIDMRSKRIINVTDPTSDQDASTKKYVDDNKNVDGVVSQGKLATTTGEVSTGSANVNLTLPGGTYGFYPQIKGTLSGANEVECTIGIDGVFGSYTTNIAFGGISGTVYAQQRYITATGQDHWIFLLLDKSSKDTLAAWHAPDHPSYGNGGDYITKPHPFNNYDNTKHYIILVEDAQHKELQAEAEDKDKTLITLINDDYKVDWGSHPDYVPIHTGKFLGEAPILVPEIPSYIKMKNLIKLTDAEKTAKDEAKDAAEAAKAQAKADKKAEKDSAKAKLKVLGLTDEELEALFE